MEAEIRRPSILTGHRAASCAMNMPFQQQLEAPRHQVKQNITASHMNALGVALPCLPGGLHSHSMPRSIDD